MKASGRPWIVIRDRWEVVGGQAVNCLRTFAREFRYDSGRARYLMRDLDLATLQPPASYAGTWTDYAQDTAYGDYTLSPSASGPEATTIARYQPGAWERQGDALRVHHGDQIGSSRVMTNAAAQPARRAVYTAFGELVLADDGNGQPPALSRYGYAGAWGYETGLDDGGEPDRPPLPFIHVGERWYDPATGRFLQRDPIGILGGVNVFAYAMNAPLLGVDPWGLDYWVTTGSWWDNFFLNATGGASSWLDDKATIASVERKAWSAVAGVAIVCVAPAAPVAYGAAGWGLFRFFGGSTGNQSADDIIDGVSIGAGLGSLPGISAPSAGGTLKGFPGSAGGTSRAF